MLDIHMFVFWGSLRLKIAFGLKIGARRLEKLRVNAMNDLRVSFNE
jgi:hypothetical protein